MSENGTHRNESDAIEGYHLAFDVKTRIQTILLRVRFVRDELNEMFTKMESRGVPIDEEAQERIATVTDGLEGEAQKILDSVHEYTKMQREKSQGKN